MININKNIKIIFQRYFHHRSKRAFSSHRLRSATEIRRQFIDNFVQHNDHQFVRSSPVVPFCDPTVAFVNAGMNQFKGIFLGTTDPPPHHKRVVNSQKCVRVGGKHNDLSIVGTDGYHHTFFEMLGNWSFGDYFKEDACRFAWNLLIGPYQIDPHRLYITYFGGDQRLGLDADLECKNIWRQLGVPESRLIPFGVKDNFWEMGSTGPCGPCTEIHIDHLSDSRHTDRAQFVNADRPDLTELWNIVFIQYDRQPDGSIISLPKKHIDTGMGLERLVAILQNANSNYDTDLFSPIFNHIQKVSKVPMYTDTYDPDNDQYKLSTAYRVLADHSRMITACLADGMLPDQNHKLRRVIRKCITLAERTFAHSNLLPETISVVIDTLGSTYPEMHRNMTQIQQVLQHEIDIHKTLVAKNAVELSQILRENPQLDENDVIDYAGFLAAHRELTTMKLNTTTIPGTFIFKMYDTYGLPMDAIERLSAASALQLDLEGFSECLLNARQKTKENVAYDNRNQSSINIQHTTNVTDNSFKYNYKFNKETRLYAIPIRTAKIVAIENDATTVVALDESPFYPESGGQQCDTGYLIKLNKNGEEIMRFDVDQVNVSNGIVLHCGRRRSLGDGATVPLLVGDTVCVHVDAARRTGNIQNHTATHLLNAAVKHVLECVTYQKSSSVTANGFKLELGVLGRKLDLDSIRAIDELIRNIIASDVQTKIDFIDSQQFYGSDDICRIPGEIYPEKNVRILSISCDELTFRSREPCCGTHVGCTSELDDFCITNVKHTGRGGYILNGLAGAAAKQAHLNGNRLKVAFDQLKLEFGEVICDAAAQKYKSAFVKSTQQLNIPYTIRLECTEWMSTINKQLRNHTKAGLEDAVEIEMRSVLAEQKERSFVIHTITTSSHGQETIPLQKATRLCSDRPVLLIGHMAADGNVRARCCVPKSMVTVKFSADKWLTAFAAAMDSQLSAVQKGQLPAEVATMKTKRIDDKQQLLHAVDKAKVFAQNYLPR